MKDPQGSAPSAATEPAQRERLEGLVMKRIRAFISLREIVYFTTLGFLFDPDRPHHDRDDSGS